MNKPLSKKSSVMSEIVLTSKTILPTGVGVTQLFYSYINHLRNNAERIAPLTLAGKLEDYLTKEFLYHLYETSKGTRFAETNCGNRKEQKIDIAILKKSKVSGNAQIEAMIEVKFFRNRHRMDPGHPFGAVDEHSSALNDLKRQLQYAVSETHANTIVSLKSKTKLVYGLVLIVYVRKLDEVDEKEPYFKKFLEKAEDREFRYHDHPKPYLRTAFEDYEIKNLDQNWRITLKCGLWRLGGENDAV